MSKFWSPAIRSLVPYTPGEQPKVLNLIKLNTNENPYPPAPGVTDVIREFDTSRLRLYPDPDASILKQGLAEYHNIDKSQVFVGNGSDEVLALAFMAFFRHGTPLLMPETTYSFYEVYCDLFNIDADKIPLNANFEINLDDYTSENTGIIFANPNAPTGIAITLDEIETLLKRNTETLVLVDEAYVDFGANSAIALINQYPNLLVSHTFSKSRSLAGMRVGCAFGHPDLIAGLERVKNSFNSYPLDMLAIASATESLKDETYFQTTCRRIQSTREQVSNELNNLGFNVLPSAANFIFASHPNYDAKELMQYLRDKNILVRHFTRAGIDQFLRITIGTDAEMSELITALKTHIH
ncbi:MULTISPECIES: histidinol-phosphate transaminase [Nitrincola]|uniref:Histidinol-phosphate aminotransferase n=1 Tax=Nitrincola nitratireducens TaxID=1229521 RepID=W9UWT0_9GAMM|nr:MULTISPECIES: histidinol-phosphate transaminase [Nitrincola]EXJ11534.1 Histidinol-phosphate aminotransferase [Nitrincola nitratireducens]